MKQYYFISGLPRSGSTLLSAILKQNPEFYADIASPVEALTGSSIDIITQNEVNLIVAEKQRKNLLHGIFDGYYQHIENPTIFGFTLLISLNVSSIMGSINFKIGKCLNISCIFKFSSKLLNSPFSVQKS